MSPAAWRDVLATGRPPADQPLADLTAELARMLGDPDPALRDAIALPVLAGWIETGVYDDLLAGLGDGMAIGLTVGLGESGTDTVFRRSFSALVLGVCLARASERGLLPAGVVLSWGDRLATWLVRERDLRGFVPGHGWAHAIAHGADALGELAASSHLAAPELSVVLDVVADRVLEPTGALFVCEEPDRLASATMRVLRRDLVDLSVLETWVDRLAEGAGRRWAAAGAEPATDPFLEGGNAELFLRALHLQVALDAQPPPHRADLLLILIDALRRTNPFSLTSPSDPPG